VRLAMVSVGLVDLPADRRSDGFLARTITRRPPAQAEHGHAVPRRSRDGVGDAVSLLDLYRAWYPFSARFLAAAGPPDEEFRASILAPLGVWYGLVPPVGESHADPADVAVTAARLRDLGRDTDVAGLAAVWAGVAAGAGREEVAVESVGRFLRLAVAAGASQPLVRSAFAEPLAAVYGCAGPHGGGAPELAAASARWSRGVFPGGCAGQLADCVRPFLRDLLRRRGGGQARAGARPAPRECFGRRGVYVGRV
jgi:hypothetical protein